ncbi:MAG TPA: hypothetical protein VGH21_08615, partial [Solirubrobacteraceae bacterium]
LPCVASEKLVESVTAACRRAGVPDTQCTLPLTPEVTQAARDAYAKSWVHRAAKLQYALQDSLPLSQAQWIGTHNSFNSVNDTLTISHADSNQQLSLTQQLDVDVRALEIDIHFIPSLSAGGARVPVVCHGQGPDTLDLGCTTERPLTDVLPQISAWLNRHRDQVILLYLEDEMKNDAAYPVAVKQLQDVLKRPDGSSLISRPAGAQTNAKGCVSLPLSLSRASVRKAGGQVILTGNCVKGWASLVYGWDNVHVESGSTPAYKPFPACDATYPRDVYDTKLVRYYEDSTLVRVTLAPTTPAVDPERLTPEKVAAMTSCGVNLFGFDQLLPQDGRLAATIWSWAEGQPDAAAGPCTVQRRDGRWGSSACTLRRRAACRTSSGWRLSTHAVRSALAARSCRNLEARFSFPRSGEDNAQLHAIAGSREPWIARHL